MTRVFGLLLALLYVSLCVSAVPIESRQLGGVACNVARLKTVAGLRQTTKAVNKLASSDDPAAADAATTAQGGLQDASAAIKTIAGALLTGQASPPEARDQVKQGLLTAQTALNNITSTDSAVSGQVDDAKAKLDKTISAGTDVLSKCGGGGGGDAAAAGAGAGSDDAASSNGNSTDTSGGTDTGAEDGGDETADSSETAEDGSDDTADSSDTVDNDAEDGSDETAGSSGTADDGAEDGSDNTGDSSGTADNGADGSSSTNSTSANADDQGDDASADSTGSEDHLANGFTSGNGFHNSRVFGKRQIGGIACNAARLQVVGRLAQSSAAVRAVGKAASGDAAVVTAANKAGSSLNSAKGAIAKIAAFLVAGQKSPPADRDQVETGLSDATTALSGINSTDPNVTSAISAAQDKISSTVEAGKRVVSDC